MHQMQHEDDLIQKAQQGDPKAFDGLYRNHHRQVYNTLYPRAHPDDVEDLVQITFLRAYQNIKAFRKEASFATWITRIAINVCNSHWRSRNLQQSHCEAQLIPEIIGGGETPEMRLQRSECENIVRKNIQMLPDPHRNALWLYYVSDHSYEDITRILHVPIGTVKTWLNRGRQELRTRLQRNYGVEWA